MFSSVVEGVTTCEFFVDNNQHTWFLSRGGLPLTQCLAKVRPLREL